MKDENILLKIENHKLKVDWHKLNKDFADLKISYNTINLERTERTNFSQALEKQVNDLRLQLREAELVNAEYSLKIKASSQEIDTLTKTV